MRPVSYTHLDVYKRQEPNWSYIPTKGESSKTQAEFVSEIRELARQAATTTNTTESEYISKQVLCCLLYTSSVENAMIHGLPKTLDDLLNNPGENLTYQDYASDKMCIRDRFIGYIARIPILI